MCQIKWVSEIKDIGLLEANNKEKSFLKFLANRIYKICELESKLTDKYFEEKTFDDLLKENQEIYTNIIGDNYKTSYGNPNYTAQEFGEESGKIITYLYKQYTDVIDLVFIHRVKKIDKLNELFIDICNSVWNNGFNSKDILENIKKIEKEFIPIDMEYKVNDLIDVNSYYKGIVETCTADDLRYLFKYGKYISDNEINTAKFLSDYSEVNKIAYTMVKGYMDSFKREKKDYTKKDFVKVIYYVGQEAIVKEIIKEFHKYGLTTVLTLVSSTEPNKQYTYDHRFDISLIFDKELAKYREEKMEEAFQNNSEAARKFSGGAYFETFGEKPFTPESKSSCLKFTDEGAALYQNHLGRLRAIQDRYVPSKENTFTIIAFPSPEIGEKFEVIFEETMKINTLDSNKWEKIQQHIINALDKGEFIHVKGRGTNKTDIMVKMHDIKNPEKETNFENCVAEVNIPVGEVFTSPTLKGTNGLLHVEEVYLDNLKYCDLQLLFEDGYIKEYNCSNFQVEEDNKKYIEENLLFPNKTLPLGEFAIGTNTLAYVIAQKYGIVNILPILIVEKMGPHFAIGDTCFSYGEDEKTYNPLDGKEIVAKDNEKSILRKVDIEKAYTSCHTDITIPYDSLGFINVIEKNGGVIEIIKEGRFILKGTEELNEPFNN